MEGIFNGLHGLILDIREIIWKEAILRQKTMEENSDGNDWVERLASEELTLYIDLLNNILRLIYFNIKGGNLTKISTNSV